MGVGTLWIVTLGFEYKRWQHDFFFRGFFGKQELTTLLGSNTMKIGFAPIFGGRSIDDGAWIIKS